MTPTRRISARRFATIRRNRRSSPRSDAATPDANGVAGVGDLIGAQNAAVNLVVDVVDETPPTVSFGAPSPGPNAHGWNNTDVSIPFTIQDTGSGVAPNNTPSPLVLSAEGGAVTGNVTATDNAGNSATVASPPVKIDKTAPTVSITVPADAGTFVLGQQVAASYACTDGLSGVDTCAGPVASGSNIDTASVGQKTFVVNATDKAGNPASLSVSYSVVEAGSRTLSALDPAKVWVGLRNSDDVGTRFDLKAEVYAGETLIGSGQLDGVAGGSSGFNNAKLDSIRLTLPAPVDIAPGSALSISALRAHRVLGQDPWFRHGQTVARRWSGLEQFRRDDRGRGKELLPPAGIPPRERAGPGSEEHERCRAGQHGRVPNPSVHALRDLDHHVTVAERCAVINTPRSLSDAMERGSCSA